MNFEEGLRLAFQTVKNNKLRTFLTALGIVIGVMSVIGMMSIINALERHMRESLSAVGGNTFWVQKYPAVQMGRLDKKYRNRADITFEQAERLARFAHEAVDKVSPEISIWGKQARYADKHTNPNISLYGGDSYWAYVNGRLVREGRMFTENDVHHRRNVIVIGHDIVERLFPFSYAVGQEIKIGNRRFRVVGVLEEQGQLLGNSRDNVAAIPYTTFLKIFGAHRTVNIGVLAKNAQLMPAAMDEVESILRMVRKVPAGNESDFEVISQDSIMDTLTNLTGFVFIAAVVICSISLLVGGIGIMNIMLVSVTERTREIGIRKAIGAKKHHILNQFMTEAVGICIVGGLIGVLLGVLVGISIGSALNLPPTIPLWSIFLGLGFSVFIGLVFGVYPAMKAARLDPIVALRYE